MSSTSSSLYFYFRQSNPLKRNKIGKHIQLQTVQLQTRVYETLKER